MDSSLTKLGTKGSDVYSKEGVGDPRVALSVLLTRGAQPALLQERMEAVLAMEDWTMALKDLCVLVFQTRDVRGGKGERLIAMEMLKMLLEHSKYSSLALNLLEFVPEYGSWRDLFVLAETHAQQRIQDLVVDQLAKDTLALQQSKPVSLMAKYAPREDKYPEQFKALANRLYADEAKYSSRCRKLRKQLAALNKAAKTVEIQMCAKQFSAIEPAAVPGRALQKYTKAFLNQPSSYKSPDHPRPSSEADRIACAGHFTEHFDKAAKGEAKINGSTTVFPHEIIKKIYSSPGGEPCDCYTGDCDSCLPVYKAEKQSLIAVWNQMVKDAKEGGGLGRSLAMCDFSGSMKNAGPYGDTPYWVSLAMGLLISEVTTEEFQDTLLTFDSTPLLHRLPKGDIFTRVHSIRKEFGQGLSTDFQKAMDLILTRCKQMRVKPGQEPENLIVLTDMNWDAACSSSQSSAYTGNRYRHVVKTESWQTHVEMIREAFKRAGEDMWGEGQGLKMPRIVLWNIAATSTDFHAKSDSEGVVMLSGWSPSLFKILQKNGVEIQNPYQALQAQLGDPRYHPIRQSVELWIRFGM